MLVIAGALLLAFRSSSRRESAYLVKRRAEADAQFKRVAIEAANSRYALNGQTAVTMLESESVQRSDGALLSYTHEAAKVVLKTKYVPPQKDG